MKNSEDILAKESVGKLLLKYSIPAIIAMIVSSLYTVVARIFIANIEGVGPLAITGVGITIPVTTIIIAFAVLVGAGAATNISIKLGEGKRKEAEHIIGNTITLSVIIGIILTIIGIVFVDNILGVFGASEGSLPYARAYMVVLLLGTVFNILSYTTNSMIRVDGNPKLSATIMVVGGVINIVLVYSFIFIFNMGIRGAALGTVLSTAITSIWGLVYFIRRQSNLKFEISSLKLKTTSVKAILTIGSAPFAIQLAASLVQVISNYSLKSYGGDLAIGAMATIGSIMMLFLMPIFGIIQGAQPIIGFNYGAKLYDRAEKTFKVALITSAIILTLGWCVIQFSPEIIVSLFGKDEELINITTNGIRKFGFMLPIVSIPIVGSNYIQAVGKPHKSMFLSLLRQVIILIPLIIILPRFLKLDGIWIAQAVADGLAAVITGIVLIKEFRSYKNIELEANEESVTKQSQLEF